MVPGGSRHANGDVWPFGKTALRMYLSLAGRGEMALLPAQGYSIQEIARRLSGVLSTISRELRRKAAYGSFAYRATTAQWQAE
jgi:IS30 family transposase